MAANKRQAQIFSRVFGGASVDIGPEDRWATTFFIHGLEGDWVFRGLWAGEGWPADITRALADLPPGPLPRDLVVTARSLSQGAIEMLTSRDANWADEQGHARIRGVGLLVLRDAPSREPEKASFSWSPSALAVAEALLSRDWRGGVSTGDLARLIDWSPPQVSQVLSSFDEKGWTVKYGPQRGPKARREINDHEALLQAWAGEIASADREARMTHRTLRSPFEFLVGELAPILSEEVRWAVSGWAAAQQLAPMATNIPSLQIYVHQDDFGEALDLAIRSADLVDVAEGGRVAFFPAHPSILNLGRTAGGLPLVSAPRVYADLRSLGGRGADAAEHLKEEVLDSLSPAPTHHQPPPGLIEWEDACRSRLRELTGGHIGMDPYARGTFSASYRILDVKNPPTARTLAGILREVADRGSGWPAWLASLAGEARPRPVNGELECWFGDMLPKDPAHADYWRADPQGRLCLIRSFQEDSEFEVPPGVALDPVLPIWRVGECLLHAERMARRLGGSAVQLMMHWVGLQGRELRSLTRGRRVAGHFIATSNDVRSYVQASPDEIAEDAASLLKDLVEPLFEQFDLFEPPAGIFEEELRKMQGKGFGGG